MAPRHRACESPPVTVPDAVVPVSGTRIVVLACSVFALGLALTWTFLGMRSVMDVGGACAEGAPYVSTQSCPDGAVLIAFAIPLMIIAAMVGSAVALSVSAPNLLAPMWAVLFGSLG